VKNDRNKLNSLSTAIRELEEQRKLLATEYIKRCKKENAPLIYITNHAIERYIERVTGSKLLDDDNYYQNVTKAMREIRAMMNEEEVVLNNSCIVHINDDYTFVFSGLTLTTIIKR